MGGGGGGGWVSKGWLGTMLGGWVWRRGKARVHERLWMGDGSGLGQFSKVSLQNSPEFMTLYWTYGN